MATGAVALTAALVQSVTSAAHRGHARQAVASGVQAAHSLAALAAAPGSVSGEAMPVGDLPGWQQVFADDFTTPVALGSYPAAVAAKWGRSYPDGWHDTTGHGSYSPSKVVSISGGIMNLDLHTENGVHLVAAPVPTIPGAEGSRGGLRYGRYAVRFRADVAPGYKTAWLLWPDSGNWPHDGEIDFPEGNLDGPIKAFLHPQDGVSSAPSARFHTGVPYTSWHTAVIERTEGGVTFLLDGRVVGSVSERVPNTPMHWVLQTETALIGPPPMDATRANVQIDWVAVWVPAPPVTRRTATLTAARAARSLAIAPRIARLLARRGAIIIVNAPAPGLVRATLTARAGARTVLLGAARVRLAAAGRRVVSIRLTPAALRLLRHRATSWRATLTVVYAAGGFEGRARRVVTLAPGP